MERIEHLEADSQIVPECDVVPTGQLRQGAVEIITMSHVWLDTNDAQGNVSCLQLFSHHPCIRTDHIGEESAWSTIRNEYHQLVYVLEIRNTSIISTP